MEEDEAILDSYKFLAEKYEPGGEGRRLYYPESEEMIDQIMDPLFQTEGDLGKLKKLLEGHKP
jgi:archaellum component FlaC